MINMRGCQKMFGIQSELSSHTGNFLALMNLKAYVCKSSRYILGIYDGYGMRIGESVVKPNHAHLQQEWAIPRQPKDRRANVLENIF